MRNIIDLVASTPQTLYLTAPTSDRDSIFVDGFRAEGDGIFFTQQVPMRKEGIDIWEVNVRDLIVDQELDEWVDWVDTKIAPSRMNLLSDRIDETKEPTIEVIVEAWFGPTILWRDALTKSIDESQEGSFEAEIQGSSHVFIKSVTGKIASILIDMCRLADQYGVTLSLDLSENKRLDLRMYLDLGFTQTEMGLTRQPKKRIVPTLVLDNDKVPSFGINEEEILDEMPMSAVTHLGNWEKNSGFRDQDRKLLNNPKSITKIKAMWKYPDDVDYNVILINNPEASRHQEEGMIGTVDTAETWLRTNMPKNTDAIIAALNPTAVNIIYTNNAAAQRVPMTGWVMAHRYGHAIFRKGYGKTLSYFYEESANTLSRYLGDLAEQYGIPLNGIGRGDRNKNALYSTTTRNLMSAICTFRSARDGKLRDTFEALHELFAQYILTGDLKFNDIPRLVKVGNTTYSYRGGDDYEQDNRTIKQDLAYELCQFFETAIHYSVGQVLVM